jgi:hypothetical protein
VSDGTVKLALPEESERVASRVTPSEKVTEPVTVPAVEVTFAVNVTARVGETNVFVALATVVVAAFVTVSRTFDDVEGR